MNPTAEALGNASPPPQLPGDDLMVELEHAGDRLVESQQRALPGAWRALDRAIVRATEFILFLVGAVFTVMITLEVISRYVLDFSMFFVDASARLLLVWFFLLGAGVALRHGAHVGFELLLSWLRPRPQRVMKLTGFVLSLVFFLEMLWGGLFALGPSLRQTEAGLGISLVWIVSAVPAGFLLLTYHVVVLIVAELRQPLAETRP